MPDVVKVKKGDREAAVVRSAYEAVWKDKGWSLVEDSDEPRSQSAPSSSGVRKSTSGSSDDDK